MPIKERRIFIKTSADFMPAPLALRKKLRKPFVPAVRRWTAAQLASHSYSLEILELSESPSSKLVHWISTSRMRERLISAIAHDRVPLEHGTIDVAKLGTVETTSEDQAYPIECALQLRDRRGWRAAEPGPQVIRLLFDQPQRLTNLAHAGICSPVVSGWPAVVPRNCSSAMEF